MRLLGNSTPLRDSFSAIPLLSKAQLSQRRAVLGTKTLSSLFNSWSVCGRAQGQPGDTCRECPSTRGSCIASRSLEHRGLQEGGRPCILLIYAALSPLPETLCYFCHHPLTGNKPLFCCCDRPVGERGSPHKMVSAVQRLLSSEPNQQHRYS